MLEQISSVLKNAITKSQGFFWASKRPAQTNYVMWSSVNLNNLLSSTNSSFLWTDINQLGQINISQDTFFNLLEHDVIISSALKLISSKLSTELCLYEWGAKLETTQAKRILQEANEFIWPLHNYIYKSLAMILASWQKISSASQIRVADGRAKSWAKLNIYDSRQVQPEYDRDTGEVLRYNIYQNSSVYRKLPRNYIQNQIVYPSINGTPATWQSVFYSAVIDALSNKATAQKQFVFFKNNAMPNVVFMLDPEHIKNAEDAKEFERKLIETYWWAWNSSKPLMSMWIKDIKTLELSHKDLQLIDQRIYANQMCSIALWVDMRVLGYMKEGGAKAEMDSVSLVNANSWLDKWANIISDWLTEEINRFIIWLWDSRIRVIPQYFQNKQFEKQMWLEEVQAWIITRNEYRSRFGLPPIADNSLMDDYIISGARQATAE